MTKSSRRSPRTPLERAQESADLALRKYERKRAQYEAARAQADRLEEEAADLKADADYLNSHPLLNGRGEN